MDSKHETKTCPRCGVTFECKVNDLVHCQCVNATLSRELSERIKERYDDCLCFKCLSAISKQPNEDWDRD